MFYLLFALFFLSGICGLVYEISWSREFVAVLGSTTESMTVVVASFMGGLGLGGVLGGRLADRGRVNPVAAYGVLEGGVGLFAVLIPWLIRLTTPVLAFFYVRLPLPAFHAVQLALCCLIVFPPTVMMGATLPLLVKTVVRSRSGYGAVVGRLYGVNTLGAMMGAAIAGFILLPRLGNHLSVVTAAGLNLVICGSALALRGRLGREKGPGEEGKAPSRSFNRLARVVLAGYLLSGMAALVYQIAWTRSLILILGSSTYSFSLVLVVFIGGLGAGSALISRYADRIKRPLLAAALIETAIALSGLAVMWVLDRANLDMNFWMVEYAGRSHLLKLLRWAVAAAPLAVPTLLMGALLPILTRVVAREHGGEGEPMGWIYGANTLGSVVGAMVTGFFLINLIGLRHTLLLAGALSLAVGAGWLIFAEISRRAKLLLPAGVVALGAAAMILLPPANPLVVNSSPTLYARKNLGAAKTRREFLEDLKRKYQSLYFREDAEATVSVQQQRINGYRELRINGKVDASTSGDVVTNVLIAQLPLLIHPHPRSVLVVGLASGMTGASALTEPIEHLDCFELSPAVVEASHYFTAVTHLDYQDPRLRLEVADARNHLAMGARKYDVIISIPSNPWQLGQGLLFTREYFELLRQSLNPGGIAVVWTGVYNMTADQVSLVARTLLDVFPQVSLWESVPLTDYIFLVSEQNLVLDYPAMKERAARTRVRQDLERAGLTVDDILARLILDDAGLRDRVGPGPLHTDDRRQLEFEMPEVLSFTGEEFKAETARRFFLSDQYPLDSVHFGDSEADRAARDRLRRAARDRRRYVDLLVKGLTRSLPFDEFMGRLEPLVESMPEVYPVRDARMVLAQYLTGDANARCEQGQDDRCERELKKAHRIYPDFAQSAWIMSTHLARKGDLDGAVAWAEKGLAVQPGNYVIMEGVVKIKRRQGDLQGAETYARKVIEAWPDNPDFHADLAEILLEGNQDQKAQNEIDAALQLDPRHAPANFLQAVILADQGKTRQARQYLDLARSYLNSAPNPQKLAEQIKLLESTLQPGH